MEEDEGAPTGWQPPSHCSSTTTRSPWVLISTVYNAGDEILISPLWVKSTIAHRRQVATDLQRIIHWICTASHSSLAAGNLVSHPDSDRLNSNKPSVKALLTKTTFVLSCFLFFFAVTVNWAAAQQTSKCRLRYSLNVKNNIYHRKLRANDANKGLLTQPHDEVS